MSNHTAEEVHSIVRQHYDALARGGQDSCCSGDCCQPVQQISGLEASTSMDCCSTEYSAEHLAALPASVTELSLGCGDPVSQSPIQAGDTVLDLGAGGGIDCFLAARRTGPTGRVIGVDMTDEMLARARANADKLQAHNVEFRQGQIEALPVEDATVDVVLSNCVINLSPDKPRVFAEMFRVLKTGGHVSVSDIVTHGPMSPIVARGMESWAACVAGALDAAVFRDGLEAAGFVDVLVTPKTDGPSRLLASVLAGLPFSALITAKKP